MFYKDKLFIDDVVFYILASLPNTHFDTIAIHKLFYQLKSIYPDCFENLLFSTSGTIPFSNRIESIIFHAYISRLFGYNNEFSDSAKKSFINHTTKKLTPQQKSKINEIINTIKTEKLL